MLISFARQSYELELAEKCFVPVLRTLKGVRKLLVGRSGN